MLISKEKKDSAIDFIWQHITALDVPLPNYCTLIDYLMHFTCRINGIERYN
jgi:hypothetical protein